MIKKLVLPILLMLLSACTANNVEQHINLYVKNAEMCEHLAGEAGDQEQASKMVLSHTLYLTL